MNDHNYKKQPEYRLFIDELGTANTKDYQSNYYILAGCSVNEDEQKNLKIWADQIKFKYWGRTDIVFHSREIGRKENHFKIFRNSKIFKEFLGDLGKFLLCAKFRMFFVILDKDKARKLGWNQVKIFKKTSNCIVKNFLLILLSLNSRGKIIVESATAEKDFYFHKAVGFYLAAGIRELNVDYKKIQETFTSVSFVTKNNFDIEEQISDLFAHAAKCKYLRRTNILIKKDPYEDLMLNLLKKKIFKKPRLYRGSERKYFEKVDSFAILPD